MPHRFYTPLITPLGILDRAPAFRAIPRIILPLPLCKRIIAQYSALILLARKTLVADGAALSADRGEAGGAGEDFVVGRDGVYLVAVGG